MSPRFSWAIDGEFISGQSESTLQGSLAAVAKSKVLTCAVALGDGTITSTARSSAGTTVLNSAVVGNVLCAGAVPHAIGKTGSSYAVACSGATDSDGNADFEYRLETISGTCPTIAANGALPGTFTTASDCAYKVKACDNGGCTALSPTYKLSSYSLAAGLSGPSLGEDCTLSFAGTSPNSANLSNLTYYGTSGLSGTNVTPTGLSVVLAHGTHNAGSYQASWGVSSGDIFGVISSTSVTAAATPLNFAFTVTDPTTLAPRTPAATLAGNVQVGRQIPATAPGTSTCVSSGTGNYAMVSAGAFHTCALTSAGAVKCWGENGSGQLGDNSTTSPDSPVDVIGLSSGISALATGDSHTCALTHAGAVKCWGDNTFGQLGDNSIVQKNAPEDVLGLSSNVTAITAGSNHTCALTNGGVVKCWGDNSSGQLGVAAGGEGHTPIAVSGLPTGMTSVAAGNFHTCALTTSGAVKCWGQNDSGQLGDTSTTQRDAPVDVSGLSVGVVALALGGSHSCALTSDRSVKCWGQNDNGQIGDNSITQRLIPTDVNGLSSGVASIAAGLRHACALSTGGVIKCWGANTERQLGDGSTTDSPTPSNLIDVSADFTALSAGKFHTCALRRNGKVNCWGHNWAGRLGDKNSTRSKVPEAVTGLSSGATALTSSSGNGHTCALTSGGALKCWGPNYYGQLGDNATTDRTAPVDVVGLSSGVIAISAGLNSTCAVTGSGAAKC